MIIRENRKNCCSEEDIKEKYRTNLEDARKILSTLEVADGRAPQIKGLNGWIFEQTIHYCLQQELRLRRLTPKIVEQQPLFGRVKIDLLVGRAAIEIKSRGSFGNNIEKYKKYRIEAEKKGWVYFYLTGGETYKPYRLKAMEIFGRDRAFFLDTEGDWARFVKEVEMCI